MITPMAGRAMSAEMYPGECYITKVSGLSYIPRTYVLYILFYGIEFFFCTTRRGVVWYKKFLANHAMSIHRAQRKFCCDQRKKNSIGRDEAS
jgi:hypothetical protein